MKPKKVMAMGAFDVLHQGHFDFFNQAAALGDELHVAVGRDATIEKIKGDKPWRSEEARRQEVEAVPEVTKAYIGYLDDKYRIIEEVKPDIIALGYDQINFTEQIEEEMKKRGVDLKIVRLKPFHPEKFKSSIVKKEMSSK